MALPQEKITRDAEQVRYARVDVEREYVAGQAGLFSTQVGQILLSLFNDDAELKAGPDVYERMATDPEVAKCKRVLKDGVTSGGYTVIPAISEKDSPDFAKAIEAQALCEAAISSDSLPTPFVQTLDEMVDGALTFGHKVAEKTYRYETVEGKTRLLLKSVMVKPRGATSFVVDEFMNLLGLTAARIAGSDGIGYGDLIPREKFFVLTFNRRDEDPRGRSFLRAAYNFWQAKRAGLPIYLKWMEKSAIPAKVGITSDTETTNLPAYDSQDNPLVDSFGNQKTRTPTEVMAEKLADLENGSAAAFPAGSDVKTIAVLGDGSQFSRFFEVCNGEISQALLLQTLATREGSRGNGSRAASQTHMAVLELLIWHLKTVVCDAVRTDIFRDLVRLNLGEEYVRLTPRFSLGKSDRDWSPAEAAALGPSLTDSQWTYVTGEMSIPAPLEGEVLPSRVKAQAVGQQGSDLEVSA